jgi:hypothetical protein
MAQNINSAFDVLRKSEFKLARANKDNHSRDMLEPHRWFILVSRSKVLSKSEEKLIDKLRFHNRNIHLGMMMVEYFPKALDQKNFISLENGSVDGTKSAGPLDLSPFLNLLKP